MLCDYCQQPSIDFDLWTDDKGRVCGRKCRERCAAVAFITLTINRCGFGR